MNTPQAFTSLRGWLRLSLTVDDATTAEAADRIAAHAATLKGHAA